MPVWLCVLAGLAGAASPAGAQTRSPIAASEAAARLQSGREALRAGDRFTAVRLFAEARRLRPDDAEVARALADALAELGGYHAAAAALAPDDDIGLRSRIAATHVRWGTLIEPADPAQRFARTDAALAELDALIDEAQAATPVDAGLLARLQRDRVVALRNRERWGDAIAQADALRARGEALQPYVRQAEADALLALRRPEQALQAYDEVLATEPRNRDARAGRFYAQVETEDADGAFATADALAAEGRPLRWVGVQANASPNDEWLDNQILAAQARRFFDRPGEAWRRTAPLAAQAPASAWLRTELGETAAARGWVRRGDEELRIAASLAPEEIGIQLALAESAFRRRRWHEAQARAERIAAVTPDHAGLQRLQAELDAHHSAELLAGVQTRAERGGATSAPGDALSSELRVYTPPLGERWRVLAAYEGTRGRPPGEDRVTRERTGAGIEGRWPDWMVEAVIWSNHGTLRDTGATLDLTWERDDRWTFNLDLQRFSAETPLRALQAGIRADSAGLTIDYARDESQASSAGVRWFDFSDGNRRWQALASHERLLLDRAHVELRLRPSLYASRNSRADAPYFNPRADAALDLQLDLRHVLWRRYEKSLTQRLALTAGGYWQRGFDTGATGSVAYEQTWRHDPRVAWDYGLELGRRRYDGVDETALDVFVRYNRSF